MTDTKILTLSDFRHSGRDVRSGVAYSDFNTISWIYSCTNRIATTASGAPLLFYEGDSSIVTNEITDKESDILKLFNPPSAPQITSLRDLIKRTFTHLGIAGKIFWIFSSDDNGGVFNRIDVRSNLRPILKDPAGKRVYAESSSSSILGNHETYELLGWYNRTYGNDRVEIFDTDEVLPILYYNPFDVYDGLSPLAAARLSINSERKIAEWNAAFFKIGMKNPIIIKAKGTLTTDQKTALRKEIRNYYSGVEGGQGALLLEGNVETTEVKISPKDVDFVRGKELNREEIAAIYGVPPALLGIFNYSNYCVVSTTLVALKGGLSKKIVDIRPGDKILSKGEEGIEEREVISCQAAGKKSIYKIRTSSRIIDCSEGHKFFTLLPGVNPSKPRRTDWVPAEDLKCGSYVAIVTKTPEQQGTGAPNGMPATEALMHQLGLYVGDGTSSPLQGINIGRPATDPSRDEYIEEARNVWPTKKKYTDGRKVGVSSNETCFNIHSRRAGEIIEELGFAGISKTKRIPDWVFGLTDNLKKALLQGIFDTDGSYDSKGRVHLAFSNELLIHDVRNLCISVGYVAANVRFSDRVSNYGPNPMWGFLISFGAGSHKHFENHVLPEGLEWERVKAIEVLEDDETFDLTIEGTHNYFADWFVTHNSNTREQRQLFWENTLLPQLYLIADLIQVNLLDNHFPGLTCAWDTDTLSGLRPDPIEAASAAKSYFDMGVPIDVIGSILSIPEFSELDDSDLNTPTDSDSGNTEPEDEDPEEVDEVETEEGLRKRALIKVFSDNVSVLKSVVPSISERIFEDSDGVLTEKVFIELLVSQVYSILNKASRDTAQISGAAIAKGLEDSRKELFINFAKFLYSERTNKKKLLSGSLLDFAMRSLKSLDPHNDYF